MEKSPMEMDYYELDTLLDSFLKAEDLPSSVEYSSDAINYHRYSKYRIVIKALFRIIEADLFYRTYIKRKISSFKKAGIFKSFRLYFYILKIGFADFITHYFLTKNPILVDIRGKFDDKLLANYVIAAMLYDASCDDVSCRKYLREFNDFIMFNKAIKSSDEYLTLFKESIDYIKSAVGKKRFDKFMNYIKIEHISQLMSIYQLSDKLVSRDNLFKVTLAKGGITGLAGMYMILPDLNKKERKAIYEFAGVCQIFEDIYDIYEDLENGIQTLPNQKLINLQNLKQLYFGTINNLIKKCNLNPNRPNVTLDIACWLAELLPGRRYNRFIERKFSQIQKKESYSHVEMKIVH
ncbi:MAG: hypothetical protein JSW06_05455 [Thermoplasmatales archaeon]|nr:MAG: hypothetical protein JSW06_05455 [Thermoplasmatales archaeon]